MKISRECLVSCVLLLAAGLLLRSISHGEETPLRQSFAEFPLRLEQWSGRQLELDTRVREVLRVDDYVLRQYWDAQGFPVELYIGYYKSQRQGSTYHSPKNCLPGSGWTFLYTGKTQLPGAQPSGEPVEINKFVIQKGLDKQLVLYWYQDRGRIITSEYWAKLYMIWDAMRRNRTDGAFVRITIPFTGESEEWAVLQGRAFAEKLFPLLSEYLPS
jgi:EpsI family protein